MAKPFAAVLTAYPAALADLGAVFAACPAVSADVSRANTAQAVTAVVLFVAVASAFCRAVVAAFSAVADVIVRDEAAAELAGALHIPCMRRERSPWCNETAREFESSFSRSAFFSMGCSVRRLFSGVRTPVGT